MTFQIADVLRTSGLAAGLAISVMLPTAAGAADPAYDNAYGGAPAGPTIDTVIYWGGDLYSAGSNRNGFGIDGGFVTALNGNLGASGWTITGSLGYSRSDDAFSDTDSIYGALLLGYLFVQPGYYFTLSAGANFVDNDEKPAGGITDGTEVGAIFQYGFETTQENAFYVQSYGSYSTAYDQVYAHAKAGYKTSVLKFGGEFTVFDDIGSKGTLRYGAFVGDIPLGDLLAMSLSAGYQQELEPGVSDGFYATVGFSVPLSLR